MAFFGAGLALGATCVGFIAGVLGGLVQAVLPAPARLAVAGVLAMAVLLREAGLIRLPVPENRRLVPEHVLHRGRTFGPIQFGFELGTGMRTYSPSALPHLVLLAIVLVMPLDGALAASLGFALARWIMAAASIAYSDNGSWTTLWQSHRRLLATATAIATIGALATGALASVR